MPSVSERSGPPPEGFSLTLANGLTIVAHSRFTIDKEVWLALRIGSVSFGYPISQLDVLLGRLLQLTNGLPGPANCNLVYGSTSLTIVGDNQAIYLRVGGQVAELSLSEARHLVDELVAYANRLELYCFQQGWARSFVPRVTLELLGRS